jgi:hypothetical protein
LEKAGNRLLNDGKRGREKDRTTPAHLAHLNASIGETGHSAVFDFSLLPTLLGDLPAGQQARIEGALTKFCRNLYVEGSAYTRDGLITALSSVKEA